MHTQPVTLALVAALLIGIGAHFWHVGSLADQRAQRESLHQRELTSLKEQLSRCDHRMLAVLRDSIQTLDWKLKQASAKLDQRTADLRSAETTFKERLKSQRNTAKAQLERLDKERTRERQDCQARLAKADEFANLRYIEGRKQGMLDLYETIEIRQSCRSESSWIFWETHYMTITVDIAGHRHLDQQFKVEERQSEFVNAADALPLAGNGVKLLRSVSKFARRM